MKILAVIPNSSDIHFAIIGDKWLSSQSSQSSSIQVYFIVDAQSAKKQGRFYVSCFQCRMLGQNVLRTPEANISRTSAMGNRISLIIGLPLNMPGLEVIRLCNDYCSSLLILHVLAKNSKGKRPLLFGGCLSYSVGAHLIRPILRLLVFAAGKEIGQTSLWSFRPIPPVDLQIAKCNARTACVNSDNEGKRQIVWLVYELT